MPSAPHFKKFQTQYTALKHLGIYNAYYPPARSTFQMWNIMLRVSSLWGQPLAISLYGVSRCTNIGCLIVPLLPRLRLTVLISRPRFCRQSAIRYLSSVIWFVSKCGFRYVNSFSHQFESQPQHLLPWRHHADVAVSLPSFLNSMLNLCSNFAWMITKFSYCYHVYYTQ